MDSANPNSVIRSRQNASVKSLRAAFADNGRMDGSRTAIEGDTLLAEAVRSGLAVEQVFVREGAVGRFEALWASVSKGATPPVQVIDAEVFDSAVATEAPQGVAAFVRIPEHSLDAVWKDASPLLVMLDGLQDPGNLGTVLRTAEAFGARAVLSLPGTVSAWNLKAVRASAGSVFRLPVFAVTLAGALEELLTHNVRLCAAVARDGAVPDVISWTKGIALCIGNEGRGLSPELLAAATERVTIPASASVESLNAAVAASILLYEAARHRALR